MRVESGWLYTYIGSDLCIWVNAYNEEKSRLLLGTAYESGVVSVQYISSLLANAEQPVDVGLEGFLKGNRWRLV